MSFASLLLLTAKGWSAVRPHGLHKQEVRTATGLSVFCAMGDLILISALGHAHADPRAVLVQAVFRSTLLVYSGVAAWRAYSQAHQLLVVLRGGEGERRERVGRQVRLLRGNVVMVAGMLAYEVGVWMAAVWWPGWRVLPVLVQEVPVIVLYVYILWCIRLDLL